MGKAYIYKEYFYFPIKSCFPAVTVCAQGMGLYIFLNDPCRQRLQTFPKYLSLFFNSATNSCCSSLLLLKHLALKQGKPKLKTDGADLERQAARGKESSRKVCILKHQCSITVIITSRQFWFNFIFLLFCPTFSICYYK